VALAVCLSAGLLSAQDAPQPPAKTPPTAAKPKGTAKADAKPNAPPPVDATQPEALAIQSILDARPTTPAQLFRAADLLASLGRPDLGKVFLQQLLQANPDQATLASIDKQYSSGVVLRVAQNKDLAPEGAQVADAILHAASALATSPEHLAQQIARLADPSPSVRRDAMRELHGAGSAAVAPLVTALADPANAKNFGAYKTALVGLEQQAVEPLLGVLESDDAALKAEVIEVLGRLDAQNAVPSLLIPYVSPKSTPQLRAAAETALHTLVGKVPTPAEAETLVRRQTAEYFNRQRPLKTDLDGRVEVWHWDPEKKQSVAAHYLADEANVALAGRLARDLHELFPKNDQYRRWYLVGILDSAAYRAGLGHPVAKGPGSAYEIAKGRTPAEIEDALDYALAQDHLPAATVAAGVLGEIGHVDMLTRRGAEPCPLVIAASNADRRLRYAAIDSILRLDPSKPFPGSSVVPEALGFFIRAFGSRRALVGHANAIAAEHLAGLLRDQGYDPLFATNGRDLLKLAATTPDEELILLSSSLDRPVMQSVVQQLRHDRRTALLPVGLVAAGEDTEGVKISAEDDPLSEGFPQPYDKRGMEIIVERLQNRAGRNFIAPEERKQQAQGALDWLHALARKDDQTLFDVRQQQPSIEIALQMPELAPTAAALLGRMGTASSQRILTELAGRETQPLATRQAAAAAFTDSVHRFGIRLTKSEILAQYGRYNQSATADRGTQIVLGEILDALEARTKDR
jgi:HEAT repeat protein